jgi:subtilisin family serine protease
MPRHVAEGINWAADQQCDVICMAFGLDRHDDLVLKAVHKALAAGIIVIAAAGNTGQLLPTTSLTPVATGALFALAATTARADAVNSLR